ncbi:MAG: response regulator [Burkholderiaceae bacterium]
MHSVLIVVEGASLSSAFKNNFGPLKNQWQIEFAPSAADARRSLVNGSFDVVICDTLLSGYPAAEVLADAKAGNSKSVRIALSPSVESETQLDCAGVVSHLLPRLADMPSIRGAIERSLALQAIADRNDVQDLLPDDSPWCVIPELYTEVLDEASRLDGSLEQAANLIDMDHGLSARLLKVLNSEFFATSRTIGSVDQAAYLLGFDVVRAMLLSQLLFDRVDKVERLLPVKQLIHHSRYAAALARKIARLEKLPSKQSDQALFAGLLQSSGMFVMSQADPFRYAAVMDAVGGQEATFQEAEFDIFGFTHAEVGARLLHAWGLPADIIEAVAFQHTPGKCANKNFSTLSAVYAANSLVSSLKYPVGSSVRDSIDSQYLLRVASADAIKQWKEVSELPIRALD